MKARTSSLTYINYGQQLNKGYFGLNGYPIDQVYSDLRHIYRGLKIKGVRISQTGDRSESGQYLAFQKQAAQVALDIGFEKVICGFQPGKHMNDWGIRQTNMKEFMLALGEWMDDQGSPNLHYAVINETEPYWAQAWATAALSVRSGSEIAMTMNYPHKVQVGETYDIQGMTAIHGNRDNMVVSSIVDDYTLVLTTQLAGSNGTVVGGQIRMAETTAIQAAFDLVTYLKANGVTTHITGAAAQGQLAYWQAKGGKGPFDSISVNIYGENGNTQLALFKDFVSQLLGYVGLFGYEMEVTEWALHANYNNYPSDKNEQEFWMRARYNVIEALGLIHYFFTYRSDSYKDSRNDAWAAKYTWETGNVIGQPVGGLLS